MESFRSDMLLRNETPMPRAKYTEKFKREAVRLMVHRGDRTVGEVAADVGVRANQLHRWHKRYADTATEARAERGESAEEEVKRLRRENAYLKRQQEILKKATAFFARESDQ